MKQRNQQSGFIALTSVMVITALLIIIGASLGYTGFFSRFNILDSEFKDMSLGLAESCAERVRIHIANNAGYSVSSPVTETFGPHECKIISVSGSGSYTVQTQGESQNSFSNIQAVFTRTANDVVVTSWQEVPNF